MCGTAVSGVGSEAGDPAAGRAVDRHPEALRNWIRQDEADRGERADRPTSDMIAENRQLKREIAELRRVNEVLRAASDAWCQQRGLPPVQSCSGAGAGW